MRFVPASALLACATKRDPAKISNVLCMMRTPDLVRFWYTIQPVNCGPQTLDSAR
jgi:hypothetical protein